MAYQVVSRQPYADPLGRQGTHLESLENLQRFKSLESLQILPFFDVVPLIC